MIRLPGLWRIKRLLAALTPGFTLSLRVQSEHAVLQTSSSAEAFGAHPQPPKPGVLVPLVPLEHIDGAVLKQWLRGRLSGAPPPLDDGSDGAFKGGVSIGRVQDAAYMPEYGAVITADGAVIEATVGEALFVTPKLEVLPGVSAKPSGPRLKIPFNAKTFDRAAVFMPWGARLNYGHFLIDALSSLAALDQQGLLDRWKPIAPPLTEWQRESLRLFLGEARAAQIREEAKPIVRVRDLVFATPMNHFLHMPNKPLDLVRQRMSEAVPMGPAGPKRLYLNRRAHSNRSIVNEPELEAALVKLGFVSIAPETLPVSEQIALFRGAEAVVAPSGAGLANVLFCNPGTKVFEIQPLNSGGIWVRQIAHFVGLDWCSFYAAAPLSETKIYVESMDQPLVLFRWAPPVDEVTAWIAKGLDTRKPRRAAS